MKVIFGITNLRQRFPRPVLGLGIFDGLHLGHQRVIQRVIKASHAIRGTSIILTFDPHPLKILYGKKFFPLLINLRHRLKLFEALKVDICIVVDFNRQFAKIPAEKFIMQIVNRISPYKIIVGEDFTFGNGTKGNIVLLKNMAKDLGFKVEGVPLLKIGGHTVSSTYIRKLIKKGRLKEAEKFLGRPFSILASVLKERGIGKRLGFPTANLGCHHEIIPPEGVYLVRIILGKNKLPGLCNIGRRPTFFKRKTGPKRIEAHILGFNRDIYGQSTEVEFLKKIREEKKFTAKTALIKEIEKDRRKAYKYFFPNPTP
ncbi:MAG: bifunctional riboflavin kinase/FAD synthetase [Candidatus Omnitrophota bacterium]